MLSKIGTIELLRLRVYPLDAESHDSLRSEVVVEPGEYDVYSDGLTTFWMMRGKLNQRGAWRMGDGMFTLNPNDDPADIEVVFPSRRFGPDEWADLIAGPEFAEGPEQRLRLSATAVTP
jgi:hypothetical protein